MSGLRISNPETIWRNIAEEVGLAPMEGANLRQIFYHNIQQIEAKADEKIKEEKQKADVAERKVELLEKELDILYNKYVEEKAMRIFQNLSRGTSEASGETENGSEG